MAANSITGDQVNEASLNIPAPGGVNAGTLDGIDSLGFLRSDGTAENSLRLGGQLPSAFLGASAKASDSDLLDGLNSTAFLGSSAKASDSDLLDGLNSTAFLGASAKASDSDLLDGRDSAEFLSTTGTATNSDRLDGLDSSSFLGSSVVIRYGAIVTAVAGSDIYYGYAACAEGESVVSGGHQMTGANWESQAWIFANRPSIQSGGSPPYTYPAPSDGASPTGWTVGLKVYTATVPFRTYVLCAA